jgi:hypothetical protein
MDGLVVVTMFSMACMLFILSTMVTLFRIVVTFVAARLLWRILFACTDDSIRSVVCKASIIALISWLRVCYLA